LGGGERGGERVGGVCAGLWAWGERRRTLALSHAVGDASARRLRHLSHHPQHLPHRQGPAGIPPQHPAHCRPSRRCRPAHLRLASLLPPPPPPPPPPRRRRCWGRSLATRRHARRGARGLCAEAADRDAAGLPSRASFRAVTPRCRCGGLRRRKPEDSDGARTQ
jgi:hypothetical protein